jgi:hypothetical protein
MYGARFIRSCIQCVPNWSSMDRMSVRIDSETKHRMEDLGDVNWAEVIRRAVRERIELEDELRRPVNRRRTLRAMRAMDDIRSRTNGRFDSTKEIRKWRNSRR